MTQQHEKAQQPQSAQRKVKPYSTPRILHEMRLETRAGSVLGMPNFELPSMGEEE